MSLIIFGANILLIMAVWHFMIRKTALDHTRDKLFDLRDEIRATYLKEGWDMEGGPYKNLRNSLNSFLRYTENYSVWAVVKIHSVLDNNAELREYLMKIINSKFETQDEKQAKYIQSVRENAQWILMEFSVYSSGLLMLIFLVAIPGYLLKTVASLLGRGFFASISSFSSDVLKIHQFLSGLARNTARKTASIFVDRDSLDAAASGLGRGAYAC